MKKGRDKDRERPETEKKQEINTVTAVLWNRSAADCKDAAAWPAVQAVTIQRKG